MSLELLEICGPLGHLICIGIRRQSSLILPGYQRPILQIPTLYSQECYSLIAGEFTGTFHCRKCPVITQKQANVLREKSIS